MPLVYENRLIGSPDRVTEEDEDSEGEGWFVW